MRMNLTHNEGAVIPEGEHVFRIVSCEFNESFGKLKLCMETRKGQRLWENYSFVKKDGSENADARKAFSYMAQTAFRDKNLDNIDTDDLVGKFIKGSVEHYKYENKDGKETTGAQKSRDSYWQEVTDEEIRLFMVDYQKVMERRKEKLTVNTELEEPATPQDSGEIDLSSLLNL